MPQESGHSSILAGQPAVLNFTKYLGHSPQISCVLLLTTSLCTHFYCYSIFLQGTEDCKDSMLGWAVSCCISAFTSDFFSDPLGNLGQLSKCLRFAIPLTTAVLATEPHSKCHQVLSKPSIKKKILHLKHLQSSMCRFMWCFSTVLCCCWQDFM